MRGVSVDAVRVSISSQPSSSSQGSGQDDYDTLGDVFMWGEGVGNGLLGGGLWKLGARVDALLPKAVGPSVVIDAKQIACGRRHAALVTKHGELFTWGEESGGWLGHGVDTDVPFPKLVDSLTDCAVEFAACGEYHTCVVTQSGDVYTWGDGAHKVGLLGHGNDISQWVPRKISGQLEGLRVSSIACGPWHTALVTVAGQIFTFGDGTFGVLGHGDRKSISFPREIDSLKGLKTVRAACGVWHTAAVVEVMVGYSSSSNCFSGKLFTWGDGDRGQLGHEDREPRLNPTCVSALIDYNFRQVVCGHSLTVSLTTSGHVFTVGSVVYGQLGEPRADGKTPVRVEGRLWDAVVEEIACGAHHVAVLTAKSEVYTWGKGANGRLGHGDVEDKTSPTLVETLKDKQVRSIACGSSFTAAICLHKWVSGSEQSLCASCRQPFSFTRKRHNCYNCGIVVCHGCSSKKAYRALMAPNPNKPYRVCDPCYVKLKQVAGHKGSLGKAMKKSRMDGSNDKLDKVDINVGTTQAGFSAIPGLQVDLKSQQRRGKKAEFASGRVAPAPAGLLMWGETGMPMPFDSVFDPLQSVVLHTNALQSRRGSRSVSPFSRRSSPPRSTTPIPTLRGLISPKTIVDDLKNTNEALSQEVLKLRTQIEGLVRENQSREAELQRKANDAMGLLAEESAKCKAAKDVIKSLTSQLKSLAEKLPDAPHQYNRLQIYDVLCRPPNGLHSSVTPGSPYLSTDTVSDSVLMSKREEGHVKVPKSEGARNNANGAVRHHVGLERTVPTSLRIVGEQTPLDSSAISSSLGPAGILGTFEHEDRVMDKKNWPSFVQDPASEWVEQVESGVYITLAALPNGGRDLKRVRFSRKRFTERDAELWWAENRVRVFEKYNIKSMDKTNLFESKTGRDW